MSETTKPISARSLFIMVAILVTVPACGTLKDAEVQPPAGQIVSIKKTWEEQCERLNPSELLKSYPARKLELLVSILNEATAEQRSMEFDRLLSAPLEYEKMPDYDSYLSEAFVVIYERQKDRAGIVAIMSATCLRYMGTIPIELHLLYSDLEKPLLIVFESQEKASDEQLKNCLLAIIRQAFKTMSEKYRDSNEFLTASKDWYLQNSSRLKPNPSYDPNGDSGQQELFLR